MFDFVFQFGGDILAQIFNEMRKAALPLLPQTLQDVPSVPLSSGASVDIVVNVPDVVFPLSLNAAEQTIEIVVPGIELQSRLRDPVQGDVLFQSVASFLLRLPLGVETTDDELAVGTNPDDFDSGTVLAVIDTGHPLADDAVFLDIVSRQLHTLVTQSGFPLTLTAMDVPLEGGTFEVSTFVRLMNDVDHPGAVAVSVELGPQPNTIVLVLPLEIWGNVELAGTDVGVVHTQALAELRITVAAARNLNPPGGAEGRVTLFLASGEAELQILEIVDGDDITGDPVVWNALQAFVRDQVADTLRDAGDLTFPVISLDQLTSLLRDAARQAIARDGSFIAVWHTDRTAQVSNVEALIVDEVLSIGINGGLGDDHRRHRHVRPVRPRLRRPHRWPGARRRAAGDPSGAGSLRRHRGCPFPRRADSRGGVDDRRRRLPQRNRHGAPAHALQLHGTVYSVRTEADIARLPDADASPTTGNDRNQATLSIDPALQSNLRRRPPCHLPARHRTAEDVRRGRQQPHIPRQR